jgi:glutathione reductase (NADPH)
MQERFDLVIVGTGVAASTVAYPCREAGWRVAVVDSRPFGGTCPNRGCDPKKVLVGAAEIADAAVRMKPYGVASEDLHIEWGDLMRFKRTFTDPVPESSERSFREAGIDAFHGVACFRSPDTMEIAGERITSRHFLIASGSAPARLRIPGEELLTNSDGFLELDTLPESIVFIGGGYIAFEFAHLAARAGARVSILHRGKRPLEHFDGDMVDRLVAHSRKKGIDIRLNAPVTAVEQLDSGAFRVQAGGVSYQAALAIHAAGRPPNLQALDLKTGGVEASPRGVMVNSYLQSVSNPRVYAAGDSADSGAPALTPIARYHGRIVADNLLKGNHREPNYSGVASAVYTLPTLAMVGLTEEAASAKGLDFDVHQADMTNWYSHRRVAAECAAFKTLVERGTSRVLGAHIFGEGAEEVINIFALGIRQGLTAAQIKEPLYAYPTRSSDIEYLV